MQLYHKHKDADVKIPEFEYIDILDAKTSDGVDYEYVIWVESMIENTKIRKGTPPVMEGELSPATMHGINGMVKSVHIYPFTDHIHWGDEIGCHTDEDWVEYLNEFEKKLLKDDYISAINGVDVFTVHHIGRESYKVCVFIPFMKSVDGTMDTIKIINKILFEGNKYSSFVSNGHQAVTDTMIKRVKDIAALLSVNKHDANEIYYMIMFDIIDGGYDEDLSDNIEMVSLEIINKYNDLDRNIFLQVARKMSIDMRLKDLVSKKVKSMFALLDEEKHNTLTENLILRYKDNDQFKDIEKYRDMKSAAISSFVEEEIFLLMSGECEITV